MGIINTQAVADGRKVRTGKDGALYNGKGKLLATVEVFQAQMGVANQIKSSFAFSNSLSSADFSFFFRGLFSCVLPFTLRLILS